MILGFGVVYLGMLGVVAASLAAPFAAVIDGVARLRGAPSAGLRAWVWLTTAALVVLFLEGGPNAASGVDFYGIPISFVPWAWLVTALAWLGFFLAARRRRQGDAPPS